MKNQIFTAMILLSLQSVAIAQEKVDQEKTVECRGEKGELILQQNKNFGKLSGVVNGVSFEKIVYKQNYDKLVAHESVIRPVYNKNTYHYFDITAYNVVEVPGHFKKVPLRPIGKFATVWVEAHLVDSIAESLNLRTQVVFLNNEEKFKFDNIHYYNADTEEKFDIFDLGKESYCSINL